MTHFSEAEKPVGLQLFGSEPSLMAEAAQKAEKLGVDLIDLNFGCPARRIVRSGEGGALLKEPGRCSEIFKAVARAVDCPVTVKLRLGWDENRVSAVEIARRAEEAGLAGVTVHGRTVSEGFGGRADWEGIGLVKRAVSIPVLGNGDVATAGDAAAMLERCGCDGVMIGRAALGNPWIFTQARELLGGKGPGAPPALSERFRVLLRHLEISLNFRGEAGALREMRCQVGRYLRGFPGAAQMRGSIIGAASIDGMRKVIRELTGGANID